MIVFAGQDIQISVRTQRFAHLNRSFGVAVPSSDARKIEIPPALARELKLRRGPEVQIETASDVIPGYLVTLDDVSIGPLSLKRVPASVSERSIHDEVLLGMSFLRHFELWQRGRNLTLRAQPAR